MRVLIALLWLHSGIGRQVDGLAVFTWRMSMLVVERREVLVEVRDSKFASVVVSEKGRSASEL